MIPTRRSLLTFTLAGSLAACQPAPDKAPAQPDGAAAQIDTKTTYDCGALGSVDARFTAFDGLGVAVLTLPKGTIDGPIGDRLLLPHVVSASGARYASDDVEFWSKGDEATLTLPAADGGAEPRVASCTARALDVTPAP